ncbi:MAG: hypothetical protein LBS55_02290 [Prevotellaceae bacterium]|jgi:hypothetical protein|nr:hypothetical protein [Prevotellaceae bacterium]
MRQRKINKKSVSIEIMARVGDLYNILRASCIEQLPVIYGQLFDDIFHDTIIYVAQDRLSAGNKTDSEFIKHFLYRFKMITFQTVKDIQQLKETIYADNKQAEEE